MAYTGTLSSKPPADEAPTRLSRNLRYAKPVLEQEEPAGKIAFWLFLGYTFINLGRPQDFARSLRDYPIAWMTGGPAILLLLLLLATGQIRFRNSAVLKIMFALTVWFLVGIPFAFWRSGSLDLFTGSWTKVIAVMLLLTQTMTSLPRVRKLLWTIFMSGLFSTSLSLIYGGERIQQAFESADVRFLSGGTNSFFAGNFLGIATAVLIPFILALLLHSRSMVKSLLLVSVLGTMMFMLVLTASRGGTISVLFSLILVWALQLRGSFKARLLGVLFTVVMCGAVAVAPGAFWARIGTLWQSQDYASSKAVAGAESSQETRTELLKRSIKFTIQRPIFGLGIGNFRIASGSSEGGQKPDWEGTHNTYTQASSECGLPGLGIFLGLLFVMIRDLRRMEKDCPNRPELQEYRSLITATLVSTYVFMFTGLFAHLVFEFYVYYLAGIAVSLGIIFEMVRGDAPAPVAQGKGRLVTRQQEQPA